MQALYLSCGHQFWDPTAGLPFCNIPKNTYSAQAVHSGFTSAFWIGGYDTLGTLHVSAMTYRQSGHDFWPGPIDTVSGSGTAAGASSYDKVWKISYNEINQFITRYSPGNVPATYTPSQDFLTWPAQGQGSFPKNWLRLWM